MARLAWLLTTVVALAACEDHDVEAEDECPIHEPVPGLELEFLVAVCEDSTCASITTAPLTADANIESWEPASLRLELECRVAELRSGDLTAGLQLVLTCELDAEHAGPEQLIVTGIARPTGASSTLDVSMNDSLLLVIESIYDGYTFLPSRTSLVRADDGQLVLMHNLVSEPPIELRRRSICVEESHCSSTRWDNEIGFGSEGDEVWIGPQQVADLEGGLRAWVSESNGFSGSTCGIYSDGDHTVLLVARLR